MSAWFQLYVIDHKKFPATLPANWSGQKRYDAMADIIHKEGALWDTIEMHTESFIEALQIIDGYIGKTDILPLMAFHGSPNWLLEGHFDVFGYGYFTPEMAEDLAPLMSRLEELAEEQHDDPAMAPMRRDDVETVFYAFKDAFQKAARRHYGVAVIQS